MKRLVIKIASEPKVDPLFVTGATPTGIRTLRRSTSITIPNRIDKIDSEHSLDASDFPRLSFVL